MSRIDITADRILSPRQEYQRRYYLENKAECNAKGKLWADKNRALIRERSRRRYYAKKAEIREIQKRYDRGKIGRLRAGDKTLHAKYLCARAKVRARQNGIPFDITYRDVPVPEVCPVLCIPLKMNRGTMLFDSATIDRIKPELGYIKGNVLVVSMRANLIKNCSTPEQIMAVAQFYMERLK